MQPKLQSDTFYIPVTDGIYFRNNHGSLKIKGKNIYRWVESLAPYLDGTHTLADLVQGLDTEKQAMVTQLLESLLTHHFLRDTSNDQPHTLSQMELDSYAAEITFIESFHDSAPARFERFRNKRVLVIGAGQTLTALVHAILKGGLRYLSLLITDECDTARERQQEYLTRFQQRDPHQMLQELSPITWENDDQILDTLEPFDVILHVSDRPMLLRAQKLNRLCFLHKKPLLQAVIVKDEALIGPLVSPTTSDCWECAWRRLQANLDNLSNCRELYAFKDQPDSAIGHFVVLTTTALIANQMSFEIFKYLTEAGPLETSQHIVTLNLETLLRQQHALLLHPFCETCQQPAISTEADFMQTVAHLERAEHLDSDLFSRRAAPCIERRLGLLRSIDEGDFEQVPLNVCRAIVSNPLLMEKPDAFFEVIGSGSGFAITRRKTTQQALELYAACLVDQRRLLAFNEGTLRPLMLPLDRFTDEQHIVESPSWTWAIDLNNSQPRLVPACLAYPLLSDASISVQQLKQGVASGMTWSEAVCQALFSLCKQLTITALSSATTPFPQVDLATVPLDHQGTRQRYVLDLIRESVVIYDVTGPLQVPTFAMCSRGHTFIYTTHFDAIKALQEGMELVMQLYQCLPIQHYSPQLPPALCGKIAPLCWDAVPPQWPEQQRRLQQKLYDHGWQSLAIPLNHDPICNQILPFIVRVFLAQI